MLSKLHFFQRETWVSAGTEHLVPALTQVLNKRFNNKVHVEPCKPGGTLGVFFLTELEGKKKFIKTHLPGRSGRDNLLKESRMVQMLYGDFLEIEQVEIRLEDQSFTFLIMDHLNVLHEVPSIETVKVLIDEYDTKFAQFVDTDQFSTLDNFQQLCDEAEIAIAYMTAERLMSNEVGFQCVEGIKRLRTQAQLYSLCHGDLSNKNIMTDGKRLFVIDWEDAFWGIKNYDLYYWLTFFDQRRYYSLRELERFQIDVNECVYVMALITSLKCYLSYRNGTYINNSLSFDQRISEILKITSSK